MDTDQDMTKAESKPSSAAGAAEGHPRLGWAGRRLSGAIGVGRASAAMLVRHAPGTLRATRAGARETTTALQTLPDPTLRSLAAGSLGLGAGFYVTGARRLAVVVGLGPAVVLGAAVLLRPIRRSRAEEANG